MFIIIYTSWLQREGQVPHLPDNFAFGSVCPWHLYYIYATKSNRAKTEKTWPKVPRLGPDLDSSWDEQQFAHSFAVLQATMSLSSLR